MGCAIRHADQRPGPPPSTVPTIGHNGSGEGSGQLPGVRLALERRHTGEKAGLEDWGLSNQGRGH